MNALRPYQARDVDALLGWLHQGENPIHVMPTGGGKTRCATEVISRTLPSQWKWGFFVHRQELLRQASAALHHLGVDHGVIAPGHGLTSHVVHVASIDTVRARLSDADIVQWLSEIAACGDEIHHIGAASWERIFGMPRRRMGLTATVCRLDGKGLGDTGLFSKLVISSSIRELTRLGWLAPSIVIAPPSPVDFSGVRKSRGDYSQKEMQRAADVDVLTIAAVRWYGRLVPGQPAMVFCTGVEHAENVAAAFRKAGWRAKSVDGSMSDAERESAISGLADGRVQVLTSCALVSEGCDIPAVSCAILLRPTLSTGLFLQQVGRCLRLHADKSDATILDLVGNVALHGLPDAERQWSLYGSDNGTEISITSTWRCPTCFRVWEKPVARPGSTGPGVLVCTCGAGSHTKGVILKNADLWREPPIAGHPAEIVKAMPYKRLLEVVSQASPADGRKIEKLRGYARGWSDKVRAGYIRAPNWPENMSRST